MSERILTLNNGAPVADNQNTLTVGVNGPVLVDPVLFEKSAVFNRERIPERVVHAKGAGAYGTFTVTKDITKYSKAKIFSKVGKETKLVARFSTVEGERGSSDAARDDRGFALKFYTEEGNWDMVGISSPVFFIRDPLKFMDIHHALKKDPRNNLPNETTKWDFWSLSPESTHAVTILFSDRGIPYSYRHMHGFGVHAYSLINAQNERFYVKFHFKTEQGIKCLTSKEAKEKDLDFATRDLYDAIQRKEFPKWRCYIQVISEADAYKIPGVFDPTKAWPHKDFPLQEFGVFELNENPTNYFAEIEQAVFAPNNVVPGISFSPDKVLQGRMVAYSDAHRYRVGSNHQSLPVNKPRCPRNNYNQDGVMMSDIHNPFPSYEPNSFGGPKEDPQFRDPPVNVSGVVDRHPYPQTDRHRDLYEQAGNLFRLLKPDEQQRLAENIAESQKEVPEYIVKRALEHFRQADENYGRLVEEKLSQIKSENQHMV